MSSTTGASAKGSLAAVDFCFSAGLSVEWLSLTIGTVFVAGAVVAAAVLAGAAACVCGAVGAAADAVAGEVSALAELSAGGVRSFGTTKVGK